MELVRKTGSWHEQLLTIGKWDVWDTSPFPGQVADRPPCITCTGCAWKAQAACAFLAHHWKRGLSQDCGLREGGKKNLVSQLKGFVSSGCLTCCFLYPRQSKSPKASICRSKPVLARRGHPVTLQVHGVPCYYHYYTSSDPSFAWAFASSASASI